MADTVAAMTNNGKGSEIVWVRHALSCANLRKYAHKKGCGVDTIHDKLLTTGAILPGNYLLASHKIPLPKLRGMNYIVCSPMLRAIETALILANEQSIDRVYVQPYMAEISRYEIQGMPANTIRAIIVATMGDDWANKLIFPSADESAIVGKEYYVSNPKLCIEALRRRFGNASVCAVSHAGNIESVMNHATQCGINVKPIQARFRQKHAAYTNLFAIQTHISGSHNITDVSLLARGFRPSSDRCSTILTAMLRCEETAAFASQYL